MMPAFVVLVAVMVEVLGVALALCMARVSS
jgi:hypothetical protein